MKPLFINNKHYRIQVPTPSGIGKLISPGYLVEGSYFLSAWKKGMPLTKLSEEEAKKVDRGLIILTVDNEHAPVETVDPAPEKEYRSVPVLPEVKPEPKKDLAQILEEAMSQGKVVIPSFNEMKRMSFEELKEYAVKYNVTGFKTRPELLSLLRKKFAE